MSNQPPKSTPEKPKTAPKRPEELSEKEIDGVSGGEDFNPQPEPPGDKSRIRKVLV